MGSRARNKAGTPSSLHPHTLAVPGPGMQPQTNAMLHPDQNSSETHSAEKSEQHNAKKNPSKMEERYFRLRTLPSYICGPNEMLLAD